MVAYIMGLSNKHCLRTTSLVLMILVSLWPWAVSAYPVVAESSPSSRIVGIVILVVQSLTLFIHILVSAYGVWTMQVKWHTKFVKLGKLLNSPRARWIAIVSLPSAWASMLIVYIVASQSSAYRRRQCDNITVDPDLAGIGVRTSLYGFGGLIGVMALIGHFHTEPLPVTELTVLVWVSLSSTLFNLAKGFILGMSPSQKLLIAMVLDGYINCLSIVLAMKEALAYRRRTICSLLLQTLGISSMIAVLSSLRADPMKPGEIDDCFCIRIQWWGSSDTCEHISVTLWLYVSLQMMGLIDTTFFALRQSPYYQRARQVRDGGEAVSATKPPLIAETVYDSIPATASSAYIAPLIGLVSACISLEIFLRELGHRDLDLWKTWGQSAQIIGTIWAGIKVAQEASRMFSVKSVERRRNSLRRCSTGTLLPVIGNTEDWKVQDPMWRRIVFHSQRFINNHPFGSIPPRRPSDHARFCTFHEAWKELSLDYRQWKDAKDDEKGELLLQGAKQGDLTLTSNLLEEAAPIDYRDSDGKTALRLAVDEGHDLIVSLLLARNADCNIRDVLGTTPLHVCCEMGKKHLIQEFLPVGADVGLPDTANQWTPLHYAARFGQPEIATLLLKNRANANAVDIKRRTPMHVAIRVGNDGMVDILAPNADVNSRDKKGKTPLYIAARFEREPATIALLKHGADADIADSNQGYTPLLLCARYNRPSVAKTLLDHGCNADLADKEKQNTALHLAANYGREKVVDHLLSVGCNVDLLDYRGRTALCWAAKDDRACVRKLLKKGADSAKGDTSLLRALLIGYAVTTEEAERIVGGRHNDEMLAILNGTRP